MIVTVTAVDKTLRTYHNVKSTGHDHAFYWIVTKDITYKLALSIIAFIEEVN